MQTATGRRERVRSIRQLFGPQLNSTFGLARRSPDSAQEQAGGSLLPILLLLCASRSSSADSPYVHFHLITTTNIHHRLPPAEPEDQHQHGGLTPPPPPKQPSQHPAGQVRSGQLLYTLPPSMPCTSTPTICILE